MREIIFRGKRIDNGEWVEGWLMNEHIIPKEQEFTVECRNPQYFVDTDKLELYEIIPSTIGQYTGLTDKNGVRVFEGDVVKFIDIDFDGSERKAVGVMAWNRKAANFDIVKGTYRFDFHYPTLFEKIEVIGNIHDNPELLNK